MIATHSTLTTVLVVIDISKHRHEVLIGIPGKKRRRRMTITNNLENFSACQQLLLAMTCLRNADAPPCHRFLGHLPALRWPTYFFQALP